MSKNNIYNVFKRFNIIFSSISYYIASFINASLNSGDIILYPMFHPAVGLYNPAK